MNRKLYNVNIVSTASQTSYTLQSRVCPAATQWPTQKAMGQGAPRSQTDVRICFRVREHRDVDLILRRDMLAAGWQAHMLTAERTSQRRSLAGSRAAASLQVSLAPRARVR